MLFTRANSCVQNTACASYTSQFWCVKYIVFSLLNRVYANYELPKSPLPADVKVLLCTFCLTGESPVKFATFNSIRFRRIPFLYYIFALFHLKRTLILLISKLLCTNVDRTWQLREKVLTRCESLKKLLRVRGNNCCTTAYTIQNN